MTDPSEVLELFLSAMRTVYPPRSYVLLSRRDLAADEYRVALMVDEQGRHLIESQDPWDGHGLPIRRGGFIGQLISEPKPRLVYYLDATRDSAIPPEWADHHSLMAVPIYDHSQPVNWLIVLDRAEEGCRLEELEELNLRANLAGEVVNHLLTERALREAQALIHREVQRVAAIQRALLPLIPSIPGARVAARHDTYDQAGGDLYDLWNATDSSSRAPGNESWAVMIADASGHGPSATVIGAMLHSLLRAYPSEATSAADMLAHANRHLCQQMLGSSFVTAFLALYKPADRSLIYARAGHHPPLFRAEPGTIQRLEEVGGLPLGIEPEAHYEECFLLLRPGQSLLMYTDGICEAHNRAGDMLGIEGIEKVFGDCNGDPQCIIDSVISAVRRHEAGSRPSDDQTLLALQAAG